MGVEGINNLSLQSYIPQTESSGGRVAEAVETPQESGQTLSDAIIQFVSDQKSGRVLLQIVQPDSGKVILQIPSEEGLAVAQKLGIMLDKIV
ncbi:MAG: flagellar protein FlaG [Nitrospirota bacterium]